MREEWRIAGVAAGKARENRLESGEFWQGKQVQDHGNPLQNEPTAGDRDLDLVPGKKGSECGGEPMLDAKQHYACSIMVFYFFQGQQSM